MHYSPIGVACGAAFIAGLQSPASSLAVPRLPGEPRLTSARILDGRIAWICLTDLLEHRAYSLYNNNLKLSTAMLRVPAIAIPVWPGPCGWHLNPPFGVSLLALNSPCAAPSDALYLSSTVNLSTRRAAWLAIERT